MFLTGAASHLETFDPKLGRPAGDSRRTHPHRHQNPRTARQRTPAETRRAVATCTPSCGRCRTATTTTSCRDAPRAHWATCNRAGSSTKSPRATTSPTMPPASATSANRRRHPGRRQPADLLNGRAAARGRVNTRASCGPKYDVMQITKDPNLKRFQGRKPEARPPGWTLSR